MSSAAACATCGKSAKAAGLDKLKKCARCQSVNYCSADCQKQDWKQHKQHCATNTSAASNSRAEAERMRMELIQKLQLNDPSGGGHEGHGHSHNGQPCGGHGPHAGHGHSHGDGQDHGHSHGSGGGHGGHGPGGYSLAELAGDSDGGHGHSHGGKPCHGHGQQSKAQLQAMQARLRQKILESKAGHGHSHNGQPCGGHGGGGHGHSHGGRDDDDDDDGHGHSHNGQPCGGHGPHASQGHGHSHGVHGHQTAHGSTPPYALPSVNNQSSLPLSALASINVSGAKYTDATTIQHLQYTATSRPSFASAVEFPTTVAFVPLTAQPSLDADNKDTDMRSSFCPTCAMANTGFLTLPSQAEKEFQQQLMAEHVEACKKIEKDYSGKRLVSFTNVSNGGNDISQLPDCVLQLHQFSAMMQYSAGDSSSDASRPVTVLQVLVSASFPPSADPQAATQFFTDAAKNSASVTRRYEFVSDSGKLGSSVTLYHIAIDYVLSTLRQQSQTNAAPLFTFPAHLSVWSDRCEWSGAASPTDPYTMTGTVDASSEEAIRAEQQSINQTLTGIWKSWNIKQMAVSVFPPGHARSMLLEWEKHEASGDAPVQRRLVLLDQ